MSAASRRKGVSGEREVAAVWESHGCTVRGLEGCGDHMVFSIGGHLIHSEAKRHADRVRIPEWMRQAEAEAPAGAVPVVAFRQDRGRWYAVLPLDDLARIVGGAT